MSGFKFQIVIMAFCLMGSSIFQFLSKSLSFVAELKSTHHEFVLSEQTADRQSGADVQLKHSDKKRHCVTSETRDLICLMNAIRELSDVKHAYEINANETAELF